jgi:hypothetical protein
MRPSIRLARLCTTGASLKSSVEGHFRPGHGVKIPNHLVRFAIRTALSRADNDHPPYGAAIPDSDSHIPTIGPLTSLNGNRNSDNDNRIPVSDNPVPVNDKKFTR